MKEPPGAFFLDDYIPGFVNASVIILIIYVFGERIKTFKKVNVIATLRQVIYCLQNIKYFNS